MCPIVCSSYRFSDTNLRLQLYDLLIRQICFENNFFMKLIYTEVMLMSVSFMESSVLLMKLFMWLKMVISREFIERASSLSVIRNEI